VSAARQHIPVDLRGALSELTTAFGIGDRKFSFFDLDGITNGYTESTD
jgi:hypothetical protein